MLCGYKDDNIFWAWIKNKIISSRFRFKDLFLDAGTGDLETRISKQGNIPQRSFQQVDPLRMEITSEKRNSRWDFN